MRDYVSLSSVPADEDCAQVGSPDYPERMKAESKRYIELLNKRFINPPEGSYFSRKSFPHDFGTYHEIVVYFDDENKDEIDFAFFVEANLPAKWSDTEVLDWNTCKLGTEQKIGILANYINKEDENVA
jgi:hypothetical protein